jgi:anti-sigma factor RsiW
MMTEEQQLKLQAFLDGELPEQDAREVASWLARDGDATALHGELRNTRQALKGFEPQVKVPESREFYWSKIKREIERSTPALAPVEHVSLFTSLRRFLLPLGAAAVLAVAGVITLHQVGGGAVHPVQVNAILADAGAFTYRDESQGMTVVWLSYPAEKKLADSPSRATLPAK